MQQPVSVRDIEVVVPRERWYYCPQLHTQSRFERQGAIAFCSHCVSGTEKGHNIASAGLAIGFVGTGSGTPKRKSEIIIIQGGVSRMYSHPLRGPEDTFMCLVYEFSSQRQETDWLKATDGIQPSTLVYCESALPRSGELLCPNLGWKLWHKFCLLAY